MIILVSGNYDISNERLFKDAVSDEVYIVCDTSSGPVTITMPEITQNYMNGEFYISDGASNAATNNITILSYGADLINEASGIVLDTDNACCSIFVASSSDTGDNVTTPKSMWIAGKSTSGGGGGSYGSNNAISLVGTNFQLGGTLIQNTSINNNGFDLDIYSNVATPSGVLLDLNLNAVGTAFQSTVLNGFGVRSRSFSGINLESISYDDYTALFGREASSVNDAIGVLQIVRNTTGTPFGGIGGSIDFWIEHRATTPVPSPTEPTVRIAGLWENPGPAVLSRLSRLDFYGYSNGAGDVLNASIRGDGFLSLYQYGYGNFVGSEAYLLGVDANGNVVETTVAGGGNAIIEIISASALATLESTAQLNLDTLYVVYDAFDYTLLCVPLQGYLLSKTATIMYGTYSGQVYYDVQTNTWSNGTIYDGDGNIWNGCRANDTVLGLSCIANTFNQLAVNNTLGNVCQYNTFNQLANNNTLENGCAYNTFEKGATYNYLAFGSLRNKFFERCNSNTLSNDCIGNIFESESGGNTLGEGCSLNTFAQGTSSNILGEFSNYNTFEQGVAEITIGASCIGNTFKQTSFGFTFGDNLQYVTIEAGTTSAIDCTNLANYGFLYGNAYPSTIFTDGSDTYHTYYDPTNDRIVLTSLTTLVVSYIGSGGGGGGNANITTITSLALASLELAGTLDLTTLYIVNDYPYFLLMCKAQTSSALGKTAQIVDVTYSGEVYYDVQVNSIINGTIYDLDGNIWNDCLPFDTTFGTGCQVNTFNQFAIYNVLGNDCSYNTFEQTSSGNTLGDTSITNTFKQLSSGNLLGNSCNYNTFEQRANNNTLGDLCESNTFGQNSKSFIFTDKLRNVTIDSGLNGADYTSLPYGFMYNKSYSSTIFESGGVNYHRYYDIANDRIVVTNLVTLAVSYIGGNTNQVPHTTASGTDTYTATVSGVTSYVDGDAYLVRFTNGNTTGATLNINAIGAVTLYRNNDGALIGGDIWSGAEMLCIYNSTLAGFQCIGTSPNSLFAYVTNADSVTITKGQVVYAFGGTGDRMTVKLANNTSEATSSKTVGVVYSTSIATNQKGIIILQGLLTGLSILPTSTYSDGDSIYLGATAGAITNVKQYAPNHLVYVATVTTASNGSAGRMYVRVQNGYELDELHNVFAQTPVAKDGLFYDSTTSLWKARQVAATDIDANVTNTEFGYLDGVTSPIKAPITSVGNGTAVTGVVVNTYSKGLLISANSRIANDVPLIECQVTKTGTAGNIQLRFYWNTTNNLAGSPILLGTSPNGAANWISMCRSLCIEVAAGGGNGTKVAPTTVVLATSWGTATAAPNVVAIDWTQPGYLICAILNSNAGDSSVCNMLKLF